MNDSHDTASADYSDWVDGDRRPWRRFTARALPVRPDGRVLLLQGYDPGRPERRMWFSVGGALEDGETHQETAAREMAEEVGIEVSPDDFTSALGTGLVEFQFGRYDITQDQTFFAVAVGADVEADLDGMEGLERRTTIGFRWWTGDELESSGELYGDQLPEMLRRAAEVTGSDQIGQSG